jgi:hypothetical protein
MSMTSAKRSATLALCLALAACSSSTENNPEPDLLDIDTASEQDGLRASTIVDGEEIRIDVRTHVETMTSEEGATFDDIVMVALVTGAGETPYAEYRHDVRTDALSGTLGGQPFAESLGGNFRAARDWSELAGSQVGTILNAVSTRATATAEAGDFPQVEQHLFLAAQPGPLLQSLPTIVDGVEAVCGDHQCTVDETDANCPEDCGCAAEMACGGVAPFGCYCSDDCAENGDCCVDACPTCGAGCPPCGEDLIPCGDDCTTVETACNGESECEEGKDEAQCSAGACRAGQIACENGTCLEFYQLCDGVENCPGGEDELCECAYCDPG